MVTQEFLDRRLSPRREEHTASNLSYPEKESRGESSVQREVGADFQKLKMGKISPCEQRHARQATL